MDQQKFSELYFEKGIAEQISAYQKYRWQPQLVIPRVEAILSELSVARAARVLDFGCAKGYYVAALRSLGCVAYGVDVSTYALECAPREACSNLFQITLPQELKNLFCEWNFDLVIAKDTLEHMEEPQIKGNLTVLADIVCRAIVTVPVTEKSGGRYINANDELDKTHIIRRTRQDWIQLLSTYGTVCEAPRLCEQLKGPRSYGTLCAVVDFNCRHSL